MLNTAGFLLETKAISKKFRLGFQEKRFISSSLYFIVSLVRGK